MKYILVVSILILCGACHSKVEHGKVRTVTSFPIKQELMAVEKNIPVHILASRTMFVSDDYLYMYKEKDSTFFDIFKLPDCNFLCSVGTKGGGPDDFLLLDARSFRSTKFGFEVLEAGTNLMKSVEFIDGKLKTVNQKPIIEGRDAMNGLYWLGNDCYLSYGQINNSLEYRFLNCKNKEVINWGEYPNWVELDEKVPYKRFITYLKYSVVCPSDDKFASFYIRFKKWRIYSNKGELLDNIDVAIEPNSTDINVEFGQQMYYYIGKPLAIGDYIYVLCGNCKDSDMDSDKAELQVWDWKGNPIACYSLGHRITSFAISEKYAKVYAFNNIIDDKIYIYELPEL